jgi:hypothetical protein
MMAVASMRVGAKWSLPGVNIEKKKKEKRKVT